LHHASLDSEPEHGPADAALSLVPRQSGLYGNAV
jgi:hypothetical protein